MLLNIPDAIYVDLKVTNSARYIFCKTVILYISRHFINDLLAILKQSDILANCNEESKHCGIRKNRVVLHLATCISQRHPNKYLGFMQL